MPLEFSVSGLPGSSATVIGCHPGSLAIGLYVYSAFSARGQ